MPTLYVYTTKALGESNNYIVVNTYPSADPGNTFIETSEFVFADLFRNEVEVVHDNIANGFFSVDFNDDNNGFIISNAADLPEELVLEANTDSPEEGNT